ncbi:MAG: EF-hand domain-containing protein [Casimicrobiaceae bacterium]
MQRAASSFCSGRLVRTCVGTALAAATLSLAAFGQPAAAADADAAPAVIETPQRDPWVPPAARAPSAVAPAHGAELRAAVERKLESAFAAADTEHTGVLTRAQAKAAGLGFIDRHFDDIDTRRSGVVRFDDVMRFLDQRRSAAEAR